MTSWINSTSSRIGTWARSAVASARVLRGLAPAVGAGLVIAAAPAGAADPDPRPLSPAQIALFETPHLKNIEHPETLEYRYRRDGAGGFTDSIAERIEKIHPDGSKYVGFEFLTGEHRVFFPAVDNFHGNPLLMVFLEHDVQAMREATGIAAAYWRNRIREAFVDRARISDTQLTVEGKAVPARRITLQPFTEDPRLGALPGIRTKTYTFVLADQVPGMIAELGAEEPANSGASTAPTAERITYAGEKPIGEQP